MDGIATIESAASGVTAPQVEAKSAAGGARPQRLNRRKRIIYSLLTTALVLATVEGMSSVMIALLPHSAPRRTASIYNEQSAEIRQFLDSSVPHHRYPHPVFGWCSSANYQSAMYSTNSKALRGTKEYAPAAGPNILRIAAFGSSIVECSEVDDANAWPALIEAANPDFEVLNYGVGGYGTDQAYLRYLAEGSEFAPDVVLIGFTSDELGRTVNVYRRFISTEGQGPLFKPRYLLGADGELALLDVPVQRRADYERLLTNPSAITHFGKHDYWYQPSVYENPLYDYSAAMRMACWISSQVYRRYLNDDRLVVGQAFNETSTAFRIQVRLFSRFAEAVRTSGALPIVVFLPEKESVQRAFAGGAKLYDPLLSPLRDRGIVYLDAIEAFQDAKASADVNSWYASGGHYSPAGNKVVAKWLPGKIKSLVANDERARKH